jgi:phenylalanyl-tRNA synthetase alpha chain
VSYQVQLQELEAEIRQLFKNTQSENELEKVRIEYLARQGKIAAIVEQFKTLPLEEKRIVGPLLNNLKAIAQSCYQEQYDYLIAQKAAQENAKNALFDVTAYLKPDITGSLHLYTQITKELEDIFISMGFEVVDAPEVEDEFYNFTGLNVHADHPARDSHDTFWLTLPALLMRTHTSNIQVRQMKQRKPPFYLYSSGRCFRNEAIDATHDFMFRQGEIVVVGKDIALSHLLATAQEFLRALFGKADIKIRVKPSYFPFVEPGIDIEASCPFCSAGCSVCKKTGWIELLGAGLIHPEVLMHGGIDPDEYSGFALGFGLTRLAMLKYGINDLRLFQTNQRAFLDQF